MRTFSRWMPPAATPSRSAQIGCLASLVAAAVWLTARYPWLPVAALAFLAVADLRDRPHRERLRRMADERVGESLCTFARAFPRGQRHPWILRAAYEELQPHCAVSNHHLPLRPSDRWREDYGIDPEEFDDIAIAIARRLGLDLKDSRANPYYGRVDTVADLVAFLSKLPPKVAA